MEINEHFICFIDKFISALEIRLAEIGGGIEWELKEEEGGGEIEKGEYRGIEGGGRIEEGGN